MHRTHSSVPYDILHGIDFPPNVSSIFAYLSYFPPPPPVIPAPPPQRSWTCSVRSLSSSSCLVADDLNPPSLRKYIPLINNNQSFLSKNTSHTYKNVDQNFKSSSILGFFQNQLPFIVLLIIFLSIFIFVIILLAVFLCMQRKRQRQLTSSSHIETNNNNNNKFYQRLIPHRKKYSKPTTTTLNTNVENNLLNLTNHESPTVEAVFVPKTSGTHINDNEEQEETV
ncbi:unnamed protein product [Rotaria sordida]|uniref:Uncharacterized protein n=1 Tax=Rotaria sordida TaxID=392033 RepID=A0A813NZX7_9BILA|nr:unnamed protein product [Rotaria sordida]CAF0737257.1 unnamed protein product [Rotaria sordida]CAF0745559.1 unnamed protein product [Rotaria sordida]CAF0747003.1 unnamed protein product [Rotaria sordida]CAF0786201.1 unnamed protein product [Rotaria sordida]